MIFPIMLQGWTEEHNMKWAVRSGYRAQRTRFLFGVSSWPRISVPDVNCIVPMNNILVQDVKIKKLLIFNE